MHLKRRILDALDEAHSFDLPGGMVEVEFRNIWTQVEAELKREGRSPEDEGKTEDELKSEYHAIAERRVRLGLVLAKVGEQNAITVTQDEVNRALAARARQFPGQEQQVVQYYTSNPQAMAELRVPLFEDKVIDFLGELMEVRDKKVERAILFLDPDEAEEKLKAEDAGKEKGAKKAKARQQKEEAEADDEDETADADESEDGKPKAKAKKTKSKADDDKPRPKKKK
jgi:trigger factor